jgi:hypothetical protein
MKRRPQPGLQPRAGLVAAVILTAVLAGGAGTARADDADPCVSSSQAPYGIQLTALTGPAGTDLTIRVTAASGCAVPEVLKKVQVKTFSADGSLARTRNLTDVEAPGGVAKDIDLGDVPRDRRLEAEVLIQTGTPQRTYVVRETTRALLRHDLVIEAISPQQALVNRPVVISAVIGERNGDVGATAAVTISAIPGATERVTVPAGGQVTVRFAAGTFGTSVPVDVTVKVDGADPMVLRDVDCVGPGVVPDVRLGRGVQMHPAPSRPGLPASATATSRPR